MIYIIKHKEVGVPILGEGYQQFGVGKLYRGNNTDLNKLNPYINEVTALSDIANSDGDIVGLVHYSRFFKDLPLEKAEEILEKYDIITTPLQDVGMPYNHLCNALGKDIVDKYLGMLPFEVQMWFHEKNTFNICNMFVSRKEFLTEYCDWLFPKIVPMAERFMRENITDDIRKNRTIGYIAECLFGYYCKDYKRYFNPIMELNFEPVGTNIRRIRV